MKKFMVYEILDIDMKTVIYVGSGTLDRPQDHFKPSTGSRISEYLILNNIAKLEHVRVVEYFDDRSEAYAFEASHALSIKSVEDGGTLLQYRYANVHSEESKRRIKENHHDVSGENNPNYGGSWHGGKQYRIEEQPDDVRAEFARKVSERMKGNTHNLGKVMSEVNKTKVSKRASESTWINDGTTELFVLKTLVGNYEGFTVGRLPWVAVIDPNGNKLKKPPKRAKVLVDNEGWRFE